jgi:hypothetical protein
MLAAAQLAERKTAIGGSDVLHLVGLPPFGCTRRLWYDKKGVAEDFPFRGNRHTRRGDVMEVIARCEYEAHTVRYTRIVPWRLHPTIPYFGVHADGLQRSDEEGPDSVLEIKCPTSRWFYACRNKPEPPNEAALQLQWAMMCWETTQGTVAMFSADAWMLKYWDVDVDREMQGDLVDIGKDFWATLKMTHNPHVKLEATDPRCRECPWRATCQGMPKDTKDFDPDWQAAEDESPRLTVGGPEVDEAMLQYVASKRNLEDAKAVHEISKAKVMGLFPVEGIIQTAFARAKLKTVYRGAYATTVKATSYPLLTVKQMKEEDYEDAGDIETY